MSEDQVFPVPADVAKTALINNDQYNEMYQRSIEDPEGFWAEHASALNGSNPIAKSKTHLMRPTPCISAGIMTAR